MTELPKSLDILASHIFLRFLVSFSICIVSRTHATTRFPFVDKTCQLRSCLVLSVVDAFRFAQIHCWRISIAPYSKVSQFDSIPGRLGTAVCHVGTRRGHSS